MNEHYIVTLDHGHLRIYADSLFPDEQTPPALVESMDFPAWDYDPNRGPYESPFSRRSSFQIPLSDEEQSRRLTNLAAEINAFLRSRPTASWDFAAPADLHYTILEQLSPRTRLRLRRSVSKDLTHEDPGQVQALFSAA
ncbi:MAG: host attachment protein [Opitutus sp.]|nr:host attachment protein [Opitutus sp.]